MEISGKTSKTSDPKAAFNQACARLLCFGPGLADGTPSLPAIRAAARKFQGEWEKVYRSDRPPEQKTIEAWAIKSVPHPDAFGRFCRVCFGEAHDQIDEYHAFNHLWEAARQKGTAPPPPPPPSGTSFRDLEWMPRADPQPDELFELRAHPPQFDNEGETCRLPVTLSFSRVDTQVTDEEHQHDIRIGLRRAQLQPEFSNCQPSHRSRPGESKGPRKGIKMLAGVFNITGPLDKEKFLTDDPFDGEPACHLERAGTGDPLITYTLRCNVNDVDMTVRRGEVPAETVKQKLVKAWLLDRKRKEQDGRVIIWGRATLRGKRRS